MRSYPHKFFFHSNLFSHTDLYYKKQIQSDKYGGTTPLETYKMFVEALKQQDIDLAVKYFVQDKQGEYKKFFEAIKQEGK